MGWKSLRDLFRTVGNAFLPSIRPLNKAKGLRPVIWPKGFRDAEFWVRRFSWPYSHFVQEYHRTYTGIYRRVRYIKLSDLGNFLARLSHVRDKHRHFRCIQYEFAPTSHLLETFSPLLVSSCITPTTLFLILWERL